MKIRSILLGSFFGLSSVSVNAAQTVTYFSDISLVSLTSNNITFELPKFQASLFGGPSIQLTGVRIFTEGGIMQGSINVENPQTVGTLTVTSYNATFVHEAITSGLGYSNGSDAILNVATNPTTNPSAEIDAGENETFVVITDPEQQFTMVNQTISSSFFSAYEGDFTDSVELAARLLQSVTVSGGVATFDTTGATAPIRFGIEYTYIPEPSTALLGALGMLALLRRRR